MVHKQKWKIKQEIQKLKTKQKKNITKYPHKSIHLDQIKETLQNMHSDKVNFLTLLYLPKKITLKFLWFGLKNVIETMWILHKKFKTFFIRKTYFACSKIWEQRSFYYKFIHNCEKLFKAISVFQEKNFYCFIYLERFLPNEHKK